MGLVYGHPTDTRGWASILAAASTTRCTARSLDPLVPQTGSDEWKWSPRARAQSRSKCTRIGPRAAHREHAPDWLLNGGRTASSTEVVMGCLSATRTRLRSPMHASGSNVRSPCRGGLRLDSGPTPARPPGSISRGAERLKIMDEDGVAAEMLYPRSAPHRPARRWALCRPRLRGCRAPW